MHFEDFDFWIKRPLGKKVVELLFIGFFDLGKLTYNPNLLWRHFRVALKFHPQYQLWISNKCSEWPAWNSWAFFCIMKKHMIKTIKKSVLCIIQHIYHYQTECGQFNNRVTFDEHKKAGLVFWHWSYFPCFCQFFVHQVSILQ